MKRPWRILLAGCLLTAGCMTTPPAAEPPPPQFAEACLQLPRGCRDHVYLFLIQGLDVVDCCHLEGLRDHLNGLGFKQTYFGQLYHVPAMDRKIRCLHQCDPDARFVLIGYGCGANLARALAQSVATDGIGIDLLVYLGSTTLSGSPSDKPANVHQVINILGCGLLTGSEIAGALNLVECGVRHYKTPLNCQTLCLLAQELVDIAATVPYVEPEVEEAKPDWIEEAPTPRPVLPHTAKERDQWDFLKPASQLRGLPRPQPAPEPKPKPNKPQPERVAAR